MVNNGLKHHSAAVKPTHGLMKATKTLTFQGTVNDIDRKISGAQKVESQSLWSTLPSANDITTLGEALLTTQWKEKDNYVVLAIEASNQWLLMRREWKISNGTIPKFKRVRTVSACPETRTLFCSRCNFERVGQPCRHIMAVLCNVIGPAYQGVTKNDILVFWRMEYTFFGL